MKRRAQRVPAEKTSKLRHGATKRRGSAEFDVVIVIGSMIVVSFNL